MADTEPFELPVSESDDVFESQTPGNSTLLASPVRRKLRPRKSSDTFPLNDLTKKVRSLVRQSHRSADDDLFLEQNECIVKLVETRKLAYNKTKERLKEIEDDPAVIHTKVRQLADMLRASRHAVMYTGAGISTSADIPDYRGADGVWSQLSTGRTLQMGQNLASASPTFTHRSISKLVQHQLVKYVVSQNCDGLHLRSGLLADSLSEIHGNMYAEVCGSCGKPYYRVFDVTEKTSFRRHFTSRLCDVCDGKLKDTIVHFGELSDPKWPHNWDDAETNAEDSDLIICLGSSLKVLRSYKNLWLTDRKKAQRPKLCIINIQWTPKDSQAHLKINGKTDVVMDILLKQLNIEVPAYSRESDPLFELAVPLRPSQYDTFHSQCVRVPEKFKSKFPEERFSLQPDNISTSKPCLQFDRQLSLDVASLSGSAKACGIDDSCGDNDAQIYTKKEFDSLSVFSTDSKFSSVVAESSSRVTGRSNVPAWFGKGRRMPKKRGRIKHRRKTT